MIAARMLARMPIARVAAPTRRRLAESAKKEAAPAAAKEATAEATAEAAAKPGWWKSAEFWGAAGALAGWGMTGAAIYDAQFSGPEKISTTMTPVMIVYSSLFARWAFVVKPQNLALAACHASNVVAQLNQMRRVVEHKRELGEHDAVREMGVHAAAGAAGLGACLALGPTAQAALVAADLGMVSSAAGSAAGPFTVHFWAPMSKWMISGASMFELDRPVEKISLAQYTALTATGLFFSRYALLVAPVNYMLCSVNVALFGSSAWHLGRKIKADYVDDQ